MTLSKSQIMKIKFLKLLPLACIAIGLISCNNPQKHYDYFGEKINQEDAKEITALSTVSMNDTLSMKLTGTVEEVCQMKGCWMTLKSEDGTPIRVTFKDYGFFVPKDISGREVIVDGVVAKSTLEPDIAKHYAEDAHQEYDSTKTYIEYSIIANGVMVEQAAEETSES